LVAWVTGNRPDGPADIVFLAAVTAAPLLPIVGFHLHQARRQYRMGHSLADLREALEVARREREETDAVAGNERESGLHRVLRLATAGAASWLAVTFALLLMGVVHERDLGAAFIVAPLLAALSLVAISNALDVQFVPVALRRWWQGGIRDRLWNGRLRRWLARLLGAPERSRVEGAAAFRATEAALGLAAADLYAALPEAYREQLGELPATVAALEARAAEARIEVERLAALAPEGQADREALAAARQAAASHLGESVAALEAIRLDLLRLHANAADLAPLTTLMDAVRRIGEDAGRLADAEREVEEATTRKSGA
ncbi:MAG: hypothetical protein AB7R55_16790, partial [Gemmatimonadales bacterium]